ncbi:MAG: hypothetical protein RL556_564 [Actinomycetota bacterium]|jgi:signal transduction histidine kinase
MSFRNLLERIFVPTHSRSFIAIRIDNLAGRLFSVALLATCAEASLNAFNQLQYLNAIWFWPTYLWVALSAAGVAIQHWFFKGGRLLYLSHAFAVVFTVLTWQFQVQADIELPQGFMPWIWWQLGMGTLSAGLGLIGYISWPIIFGLPIYWVFLRLEAWGGSARLDRGIQDAVYTLLFSAVFVNLIQLLRSNAKAADEAAVLASEAIANQASAVAIERERIRIDTLVHDNVMATLIAANEADSDVKYLEVKAAARAAVETLQSFSTNYDFANEPVSTQSLFEALTQAVHNHFPQVEISQTISGTLSVDPEVAAAITEATLHAIENSVTHAGGSSVKRTLVLKASKSQVKVVVADDGRGFRPSQVPKNRIGIRLAIRGRMSSVGGEVKINATPANGCQVVLEWGQA